MRVEGVVKERSERSERSGRSRVVFCILGVRFVLTGSLRVGSVFA